MSLPKKAASRKGPPRLVLPTVVLCLGVWAICIGIPKELTFRRMVLSGVHVSGRVIGIEHSHKQEILTLAYNVGGLDYSVILERPDTARGRPVEVIYLPDDPKTATADLKGDAKIATEYLLAGVLELFVGGLVVVSSLRRRRRG